MPTVAEREAFLWMQGRLVELLLRYDAPRFVAAFRERVAEPDGREDAELQRYRQLAVLVYLRQELFGSILPRIKRRLSFAAPRELIVEELPARGRIDWQRTLTAAWRDRPGEPPLAMYTRQRRRHFATPENLLVVATLLEYRQQVQRLLAVEQARDSDRAVRHPLHDIVEECTRELVFPQFAGLERTCAAIVDGYGPQTSSDLEGAVAEALVPGYNIAYEDLLNWRRKLTSLRLLDRTERDAQPMLGADPKRDNYLYQCWIFYEVAAFLQERDCLVTWDRDRMELSYQWGTADDQATYVLRHDRTLPNDLKIWPGAPGVRPDFYVTRAERQEVCDDDGTVIWREPGYVLDAKYYRPRDDDPKAPAGPVKRMIADLQLTGERHGALLFAFHGLVPDATSMKESSTVASYIAPEARKGQTVQPDLHLNIWRLQPERSEGSEVFAHVLETMLTQVHTALRGRIEIRCHGVFLDSLTANAHGALANTGALLGRFGSRQTRELSDLLVCPKPHIAPWRVDLVSLTDDCCTNAALCHIKHQPATQKPRRLSALEEITDAIKRSYTNDDDAEVNTTATEQVLAITKRYAQLLQPNIADYQVWIRERLEIGELFDTTALLTDSQRETLALGRFLWEQIEHIRASNYAGPALLFTGVLEEVARMTVYERCPDLYDLRGRRLYRTLGTIGKSKGFGGTNWRILEQAIVASGYWQEQVAPTLALSFSRWVDNIDAIAEIRNQAAHEAHVEPRTFANLVQLYFGSTLSGIGVLNGVLLAWRVPIR